MTEIDVDESVLRAEVPVLSIQPLVENAVKHGVASRPGGGFVRLSIQNSDGRIKVEICNSGEFREPSPAKASRKALVSPMCAAAWRCATAAARPFRRSARMK